MKRNKRYYFTLDEFVPLVALFLYLPLLYSRRTNDFFNLPKFSFFEICSFASLSLFLLHRFLRKSLSIAFIKNGFPLLAFTGLFLSVNVISLFSAGSISIAFEDLVYFSCVLCLFVVFVNQPAPMLVGLFAASFISSCAAAGIGVLQHFGYDITGISQLTGVPESFMASTLGHRNYLAELLCITIPIGFAFYLAFHKTYISPFVFVSLCLMYFGLLLTNSRSGLLAFVLTTLFFCSVYEKSYYPLLLLRQSRRCLLS